MISFTTSYPKYEQEMLDIVRLFFPEAGLGYGNEQDMSIHFDLGAERGKVIAKISIDDKQIFEDSYQYNLYDNRLLFKRKLIRFIKNALYKALKGATGREMPWGSLTGIRPLKVAEEVAREGNSVDALAQRLNQIYDVSIENGQLLTRIMRAREGYLPPDDSVNLYVNIPFCTTRCAYCSFLSDEIGRCGELIEPYIEALRQEIAHMYSIVGDKTIFSTYIGGGTPTSLNAEQLENVLECITKTGIEYTLEAGRADTITPQKLMVARKHGVTRVCINPQTLNDSTLHRIKRNHTAQDFYDAFEQARGMGFVINTDLIAGLEGESIKDFEHSLQGMIELKADNITVHTLSLKSGAKIKEQRQQLDADSVSEMIGLARDLLSAASYEPYYIYRQKYMAGNNENSGWCLAGKQCVNNISVMEELISVVACGAGAISKAVFRGQNRIERYSNPKDIRTYLNKLPEILEKKEKLFKNI